MSKVLPFEVLGILIAVFLAAPALAGEKVSLRLSWDHQFNSAGFYAAQWQGYYADAGLEVAIKPGFTPDGKRHRPEDDILQGRSDFGVAAPAVVMLGGKSAFLTIITPLYQRSPVALYALKGTGLRSPADLTRLRMGYLPGGSGDAEIRSMLLAEGIDPGTINFIGNKVPRLRPLLEDRLDVVAGYSTSLPWLARQKGVALEVLRPSAFGIEFYGLSIITSRSLAAEKPELVSRFRDASLKGWRYALDHPEEIVQRIARELPRVLREDDLVEFNRFLAQEVRKLMLYPIVPVGHINPGRIRSMHGKLRSLGLVQGELDLTRFIFDPDRDRRLRRTAVFDLLIFALASVLVLVALFFAWNRSLRRKIDMAAHTLRERENRYRGMIENSGLGIHISRANGGRLFVNNTLARLLGYEAPEEIYEVREFQLTALHDREKARRYRMKASEISSGFLQYECDYVRKDGSIIPLHVIISKIEWDGEDAVQRTLIDLTDRKQAEQALNDSEELFRTTFEQDAFGMGLRDIAPRNARWLRVNQKLCDILGYTREELLQLTSVDISVPEERQIAIEFNEKLLRGDIRSYSREKRYVRKDGQIIWANIWLSAVIDRDGHPTQIISAIEDITGRKKLEEELRQTQRLEAVGRLTGGVAHDFNNLLGIINGNLELIDEDLADGVVDASKLRRLTRPALGAIERGAALTQRLLAFSRSQPLAPSITDVDELICGLSDFFKRTLGASIKFQLRLNVRSWKTRIDPNRLEDALLNLVINARDAMSENGRLTVTTAEVPRSTGDAGDGQDADHEDFIRISVIDTGTGMAPEIAARAFEPFFTTKETGKGSGLGLSMVYGFVKQSGGHVEIDSAPGRGTTVKLYLRRSEVAEAVDTAKTEVTVEHSESKGESVLVVEDEPELRKLVATVLLDSGYRVIAADDGFSALDVLKGGRKIDLLFCDIMLPNGMNGPELARRARDIDPGLKVLFTTGFPNENLASDDTDQPAALVLPKPVGISVLQQMVRNTLDEKGITSCNRIAF